MTKADKILNKHLNDVEAKYIADKRFLYDSLINAINEALAISRVSESFSKIDLLDLGAWFDGSPEYVKEVVKDWLNAR